MRPANRLNRPAPVKRRRVAPHAFAVAGKRLIGSRFVVDFKQNPIVLRRDVRHKYNLLLSVFNPLPCVKQRKVFFRQAVFFPNRIPGFHRVGFAFIRQPRAVQPFRLERIFPFRFLQPFVHRLCRSRDFIPFLARFTPLDAARQKRRVPHIGGKITANRFAVV